MTWTHLPKWATPCSTGPERPLSRSVLWALLCLRRCLGRRHVEAPVHGGVRDTYSRGASCKGL